MCILRNDYWTNSMESDDNLHTDELSDELDIGTGEELRERMKIYVLSQLEML
jgi:hypothetical protein